MSREGQGHKLDGSNHRDDSSITRDDEDTELNIQVAPRNLAQLQNSSHGDSVLFQDNPQTPTYPQVRQRGYYSELLSEVAYTSLEHTQDGPHHSLALSSLAITLDHNPQVNTTISSQNIFQNPPGSSTKLDIISDFPAKAFQPKLQLRFYTAPGTCPRAVFLEREKRRYAEYQLEKLLAEEGLNSDDIMPQYHPPNGKKADGSWAPHLFIEIFDDEEFEIRNPDEWLAMGVENDVRKPIPGRALLPNSDDKHHVDIRDPSIIWTWHSVGVLDYDIKSKLWLVQKMNEEGRIIDHDGKPVVNGGMLPSGQFLTIPSQYWIPRIQLMFLAEDPVKFASRVIDAYRSRDLTEALLRYHLYLDCMPMDGLGELDPTSLKRMIRLSKEETPVLKHKKKLEEAVQSLEKEIMVDYWRSMNTIILHKLVNENKQKFSFIVLPRKEPEKVPAKGTIHMPTYDWDHKFEQFAFFSLLTKPEVVQALCKSEYECLEARNKLLFHVPLAKHMRLDEFEQTQSQATQQVSLFLKDTWVDNLQKYIRTSLRDSGKGWFNIFETDFYVYSKSKLKKFMELVKYCMQDSMRYLVLDSLRNYVDMIADACYACQKLESTFKWPNDLITSTLPHTVHIEVIFMIFLTNYLIKYDKLNKLVKDFEPFRNLWIAVSDWIKLHDSVMNDPLTSVDSETVEKSVAEFYKTMHKSVKIFGELPGVQEVASQIKVGIEEFKPFIPLIQGLRNPGMRARHWELLSEELKISVVPKPTLTFSKCLEMHLQV